MSRAELSAGPHEVRRNDEQAAYDEHAERARRLEILQRAEREATMMVTSAAGLGSGLLVARWAGEQVLGHEPRPVRKNPKIPLTNSISYLLSSDSHIRT